MFEGILLPVLGLTLQNEKQVAKNVKTFVWSL